jgi:hypothetical protein
MKIELEETKPEKMAFRDLKTGDAFKVSKLSPYVWMKITETDNGITCVRLSDGKTGTMCHHDLVVPQKLKIVRDV